MFTKIRPIRAGAIQIDIFWRGEKSLFLAGDNLHHARRQLALQELNKGINLPGALRLDGLPGPGRQRLDFDLNFIER